MLLKRQYFKDLKKISDLVEKITGEKSYLIRFPGGSSNTVSAQYSKGLMSLLTKKVQEKGYQILTGTVIPQMPAAIMFL